MNEDYKELLNQFIELERVRTMKVTKAFPKLLHEFSKIKTKFDFLHQYTGHAYNYLDYFTINEPMHSFLVKEFLDEQASHGQGRLFLDIFLKEVIDLNVDHRLKWFVTAEKGRIDILIKSSDKHVIIIENKSNNASDQSNQLYRYWIQEVYNPLSKSIPHGDLVSQSFYIESDLGKKMKVLYLPADESKRPSENSLCKPEKENFSKVNYEDFPIEIPIKFQKITFKHNIVFWLSKCLNEVPPSNHRLREFILMYIEICKNLNQ